MTSIRLSLISILVCFECFGQVFLFDDYHEFQANDTIDRSAQPNCGPNARDKCVEPMKKYLAIKHISYGKNENELSEVCKYWMR